jgi:hypothetical protein
MAEEKWKSIKVREWVWRALRQAAAAGDETITAVVERRLTSEGQRPGAKPKAEVVMPSVSQPVRAVPKKAVQPVTRGCRRCGHEGGLHGTFSCSARDCECEGFLS